MITVYPFENLGEVDHGWILAKHHFSFGEYYNPERTEFGMLKVINDDTIQPNSGFDMHAHKDMEIITYVRNGAITHVDNQGNRGVTKAGDIQVMSAGSGIFHSEYNLESVATQLYQIWIKPSKNNVEPRWEAREFPQNTVDEELTLLVSGNNDHDSLFIHQDARIYAGKLSSGKIINQQVQHQAYVLVAKGMVEIDNELLNERDGAEITQQNIFTIKSITESEVLVIEVPNK